MALFLFLIKKRSIKSFITYANQNKLMDKDKFLQMKFDHLNKKREFRNFFHCNKVLNNFI